MDEVFQIGVNSEMIANGGFMQSRFSINTFICFKEVNLPVVVRDYTLHARPWLLHWVQGRHARKI